MTLPRNLIDAFGITRTEDSLTIMLVTASVCIVSPMSPGPSWGQSFPAPMSCSVLLRRGRPATRRRFLGRAVYLMRLSGGGSLAGGAHIRGQIPGQPVLMVLQLLRLRTVQEKGGRLSLLRSLPSRSCLSCICTSCRCWNLYTSSCCSRSG
jgi:hypothetical protein